MIEIPSLMNDDIDQATKGWEEAERACRFAQKHPRIATVLGTFPFIKAWITEHTVCRLLGHDIIDNGSFGGPDSGADHLACRRCWWEFDHTYY